MLLNTRCNGRYLGCQPFRDVKTPLAVAKRASIVGQRQHRIGRRGLSILCPSVGEGKANFSVSSAQPSSLAANEDEQTAKAAFDVDQSSSSKPHVSSAIGSNQSKSWEAWLKYFEQMDSAAENQEEIRIMLQDAVRCEDYSRAAILKKQLSQLESEDTVAFVQRELQTALQEERYQDAAMLRDNGMAGLQGWWAGVGKDDPVGHLLHVKAEFGRWTGHVYRPRDIAEMNKGRNSMLRDMLTLGRRRQPMEPDSRTSARAGGSPAMEVFVKQEDGKLLHQAVALSSPSAEEVARQRSGAAASSSGRGSSSSSSNTSSDGSGSGSGQRWGSGLLSSVLRLSVVIDRDGSASIKALPAQAPRSQFNDWQAQEALETMRELAADSLGIKTAANSSGEQLSVTGSSIDEDLAVQVLSVHVDEVVQLPAIPDEKIVVVEMGSASSQDNGIRQDDGITGGSSNDPMLELMGATDAVVDMDDSSEEEEVVVSVVAQTVDGSTDEDDVDLDDLLTELSRVPASIEFNGRDQFMFQVQDEAVPAAHSSTSGRGGDDGSGGDPQPSNSGLSAGRSSSSSSTMEVFSSSSSSSSSMSSPLEQFEVEIPVGMLRQLAPAGASGSVSTSAAASNSLLDQTLDNVVEKVAKVQEAKIGRSIPREKLAEAIRDLTRRVMSGEQVTDSIKITEAPATATAAAEPATSTITYSRIPATSSPTDPLSGLFVGAFGPHGPELLHLRRAMVDGEEMLLAVKVTGDSNVPAGTTSFRAKIGRKHKLDSRDVYPDELGIMARYKGEGRIAGKGYTNPRWVEGELLVFASGASPLTGGAELGFVWAVPGERRFLILLNKVDLSQCEK